MNNKMTVDLFEFVYSISSTSDMVSYELTNHHKRVAYLAYKIAQKLGLSKVEKSEIFLAGLLHDIGALSTKERMELLKDRAPDLHRHSFVGADILKIFKPFSTISDIIRFHHLPWDDGKGREFNGNKVSVYSHILHLADRIAVRINDKDDILSQVKGICDKINESKGSLFMPELVDAFLEISKVEYIWLDSVYENIMDIMAEKIELFAIDLNFDEVVNLSKVFALLIDFRSPFTANHSLGVAAVASKIAQLIGFSENECKMMQIAGFLHDLGKLAISNEILEKSDKLSDREFNIIKSHTYYTYRTLQSIKNFETINKWASFHHEQLNGKGYPFHLTAKEIPLGSRIMAVADIFTAITEDRPYRKGMDKDSAIMVLKELVDSNSICEKIVDIVVDNFDEINLIRTLAQENSIDL